MHHVVLTGNIGTGKTTAVRNLGAMIRGSRVFVEQKGQFLERYYRDPTYAFMNQLDYTIQFLEQAAAIARSEGKTWVLQDRSISDTHGVFSRMLFEAGQISGEQFELLGRLHDLASDMCKPTLLVLLEALPETCFDRTVGRGDAEERSVSLEYLTRLHAAHRRWYDTFDLCPKLKIVTDSRERESVASEIIDALRSCGAGDT